jgi:UDPglucose 6-dehydrogenase/GDP-mannose 6-dehydrogenase
MRVSIVGTGYVGLVTGVCLAETGHDVICVDNDPAKVEQISGGVPTIHEEGLEPMLKHHIGTSLGVTADLEKAVHDTEITLIAVGTPFDGREIDLQYIEAVADGIGTALAGKDGYHVVVVKSTVVPGTTDGVVCRILQESSGKRAGDDFGVGMNPEFLTEGRAVFDFMNPDRIVLGGLDERTRGVMAQLYAPFQDVPVVRTNNSTAEMIKYASNALLATMISFSNELATLCTALGDVDVVDVTDGVHRSQYLTVRDDDGNARQAPIARFIEAGCGFGGSCLPKDVSALVAHGDRFGVDMPLLRSVLETNAGQPGRTVALLDRHFDNVDGLAVTVLGLAFKPDTDDVRESPAFPIVRELIQRGARVTAWDPIAMEPARRVLEDAPVTYAASMGEAIATAEAILLVTRWAEFEQLPGLLRAMDNPPLVVDGRRLLDKKSLDRYDAVGL